MGYDEELARVVNFSTAAKEAIPNVQVAAPSTCSWWYCKKVYLVRYLGWLVILH